MQYKDSASDKEEPSYYPQHDYQEQDTYTYRPADEYRPDPYYGQPSRQQERTVGICLQRTSQQQFPGPEPYE
jgi:hypothetical protein